MILPAPYADIAKAMIAKGLTPDQAHRACLALAECAGGRNQYYPQVDTITRAQRDAEIAQKCDGSNINALATEYGLTVNRIYCIIAQQRKKDAESKHGKQDSKKIHQLTLPTN